MINIVLFGPPGCGKGTQAQNLVQKFNLKQISTGDILRDNTKNGTELGKLAKPYMDKGELVPDQITIDMLIDELKAEYPTFQLIEYDTISEDATLFAFRHQYGRRAMPDYDFSKAKLIVSFDADFLGDWNGGGYEAGYAQGRIPSKANGMSRHIQLEANLSLTGANADERIALPPALLQRAFAQFYNFCKGYPLKDKTLPPALTERIIALAKEVQIILLRSWIKFPS